MILNLNGPAIADIIPNAHASQAIVNASILPQLFISDVFIRMENASAWPTTFADVFPVRHMELARHACFEPFETVSGFEWVLAVMATWLVGGLLVTVRSFRWEPRCWAPLRLAQT